ncbi:gamma carbonic anhydrase family protein [Agarivorans sp. JK6]|uniref:gamma carbonic anhydrase family protein n=1 Tax=Agarivorans sp. JK6 TaxID=2997426 RepID=UPI003872EF6F
MSVKSFSGFSPILGKEVWVDPSAVLYGEIKLGDDVSIWPMVAARGDVNHIQIGARSNVQDGSVLHVTRKTENPPYGYPLIIGEDVTIGHKAMLHGCTIGNRVLVGMGAIVLDGVVVEDDVMIGAGSLVPPHKRLESGYLYMGSPAKQARPLNEKEKAFLSESADNYVRLKQKYLEEQA